MADIATISLKADTSDLERGTQKLKEFGDTAEKVSGSSRNLNDQFNRGVDHQKRAADAIKRQKKELDDLLNSINPTNKAFDALDKATQKLIEANKKGILPKDQFADYNAILEQTRDKLTRVNMSLTAEGRALLAQEAATNRAKQAADDFLNSLKNQTEIIGKTRTEILELKAAQLGVSQQAAPMINKLKEQEKAFMNGSITIGQYKQAMRQLPMQMTDIVTSLASGMPVWMVMIQQGGQIKDSFGGIGNSLKALASIITPTKIAIATATTASLALAYSAYKGSQEFAEFNKQLIMTGRYAGKTAYELNQLSKTLVGNWITQGDMASALTKVVGSGRFQGDQILLVARAAAQMEQSTGKSIDETINQFKRLKDDPVNAILELDKTLHLLTASEYEHIKSLEIAGKTQEASEFSIKKLSEETDRRTRSMNQNIGSLERAWNDVATAIKNAGNALKNIGKPLSDAEALAEINDRIKEWENAGFWHGTKEQRENMIRNLKEQQKILSFVVSSHEGYEKAQNKSKEADEKRKESIREYNKLLEDTATNAQKRTAALNKLWEQVRRDPEFWTEDKRKLAVQNINNRFKDRTSKTSTYRPDYGTRVDESANQSPVMGPAQLTNGSVEYIYLRGGAKYQLTKHKSVNHQIITRTYTNNKQSVAPKGFVANEVPKSSEQKANATANAVNQLETKVTEVSGKVTSTAQQVTRLESQVGTSSAKIEQTSKVVTDINGKISASWTMKVQQDSKGNKVITGIGLGFNAQGNSQFLVNAQNFAVISSLNGKVVTPFIVKNGQVVVNEAFIGDATITSAKIANVLQSTNFSHANKVGYQLNMRTGEEIKYGNNAQGYWIETNILKRLFDKKGTMRIRMGIW